MAALGLLAAWGFLRNFFYDRSRQTAALPTLIISKWQVYGTFVLARCKATASSLYLHITSVLPSILPSQPKHPPCFSKTRPLNFQSSASAAASQPHIAMFISLGLLGLLAMVLIYSTLKCGTLHNLSSVHNTLQLTVYWWYSFFSFLLFSLF
ncbi:hypothetical protein P167DRAFT_42711 [Morchella conica CCBAS932]|uniref:Uncharacterized protein n=1 Tax=Morchella conica CCBAS932 TaxID=1392247 RepID=A0A3N4KW18_9PEZI|nr:hypothetical protein P167DRAFT_42711 [Morchella conica CCBAS932]